MPPTIQQLFDDQARAFSEQERPSIAHRQGRLKALKAELEGRRAEMKQALARDFGKPPHEVDATELAPVIIEINHALRYLHRWAKPERRPSPRFLPGLTTEVRREPKGVSLIISPWNFVFNLTLGPLVHAAAAGCPVIIKPSEYTPHASDLIRDIVESVFPPEEAVVLTGDAELAQHLLELPFRHVYFTGSPAIGRLVMEAAANHLASVTLELGGKSPAYVDEGADVEQAARSIAFAKFVNAGQTCIAPDHVLVHASVADRFIVALRIVLMDCFGPDPSKSPDLARIVSERHHARLADLVSEALAEGAECPVGGGSAESRFIPPTILTGVPDHCRIMKEEIFGPILPVIRVSSANEAIERIRNQPPPLCAYVFTDSPTLTDRFSARTRIGAVCENESLVQFANPFAPFGGLAQSGIGRGHGKAGYLEFSNEQTIVRRRFAGWIVRKLYPPYSDDTTRWIERLMKWS